MNERMYTIYRFSTLPAASDHSYFLIGLPTDLRIWLSFVLPQSTSFPPATDFYRSGPTERCGRKSQLSFITNLCASAEATMCHLKSMSLLLPPIHNNYHHFFPSFPPLPPTMLLTMYIWLSAPHQRRETIKELVHYCKHIPHTPFLLLTNLSRVDNCLCS